MAKSKSKPKSKPKPKLVIAGVHGDERTAPHVLKKKTLKNTILIPIVNDSGFKNRTRSDSKGRDYNRLFGKGVYLNSKTRKIEKLIKDRKVSLVVDFHASINYHSKKNCKTKFGVCLGNTLVPAPYKSNKKLTRLVNKILGNLNKLKGLNGYKKYKCVKSNVSRKKRGTLKSFSRKHNVPYLLIEVAKLQPRPEKVKQIKEMIKVIDCKDF